MPDRHHDDTHSDHDAKQDAATGAHKESVDDDEDSSKVTDGANLAIQLEQKQDSITMIQTP
jgi:hypothetical protein